MVKTICQICKKEIVSEPYSGKVCIIQESYTSRTFPTMHFHVSCYIQKHYLNLNKGLEAI